MESSEEDCELRENSKRKTKENQSESFKKVKYENISEKNGKKSVLDNEELRDMLNNNYSETDRLYNNSLLRLQLKEVLKSTKAKSKSTKAFKVWYDKFQTLLNDLPEYELKQAEMTFNKSNVLTKKQALINDLFSFNKRDVLAESVLKLRPPQEIFVFGVHNSNVRFDQNLLVNINLAMPKNCLLHKDYLNGRYFCRRSYYLLYVKHFLERARICRKIHFVEHDWLQYDVLKIEVDQQVEVCVFASGPCDFFKKSRFLPHINNCKSTGNCTPFYNNILAHDCTLADNRKFAESQLEGPFLDGVILLVVWLKKRFLHNYFTENFALFLMCYLVKIRKINKHMGANQILRNFWHFMVETNLESDLIGLCDDEEIIGEWKKLEKLSQYPVIFLDTTGYYNLTQFFHVNFYRKLKTECEFAVKLLNDNFFSLFIAATNEKLQYDLTLNVDTANLPGDNAEINYFPFGYLEKTNDIIKILEKGLRGRAKNIVALKQTSYNQLFGISLTADAFSCLEKGPELNDVERAEEFRRFWGALTSDRRFKDGTCCVCVYFRCDSQKERRNIIRKIVDYLLCEKLERTAKDYNLVFNQFENLIVNEKIMDCGHFCNEEACLSVTLAADELAKKLRGLNELTLGITGVQGISDTFSFTEVFPPLPTNYKCGKKITTSLGNNIIINNKNKINCLPRFVQTVDSVLHLEYSTKWPKTLEGLRSMKTAFFLHITKLLDEKFQLISSVNSNYFDVLYKGYVFRYYLYVQKEIGLLKKEINTNGVISYKPTVESKEYEKKFQVLPKIVSALKGIQSRWPSFGPSTALAKRWLRSQLIDDYHFSDMAINLINASLYLNARGFEQSQTPQIGFLRFLDFMASNEWKFHSIIVDVNEEIPKGKILEINSVLLESEKMRILTPYDNCESIFTQTSPTAQVIGRVRQLCRETLDLIYEGINSVDRMQVRLLFTPNLKGCNLIINLKRLLNPRRHEQVLSGIPDDLIKLDKFDEKKCRKIPVVNFDPVQLYLRELRQNYGQFAEFFHDTYGGSTIGVLWKPNEVCDFKISLVSGREWTGQKLVVNRSALFEDFEILGTDLVRNIERV